MSPWNCRSRDHARHPGAKNCADHCGDQHRDQLRVRSFRRIRHDHEPEQQPGDAADAKADAGPVHQVGLLHIACFVQLAEIGAALGEKPHVAVLDSCEQQVVGSLACALYVGQEEVQASAHGSLLRYGRFTPRLMTNQSRGAR